MKKPRRKRTGRQLLALTLSLFTLWSVAVTAQSGSFLAALAAMQSERPLRALRWELGDREEQTLSPATAMALAQSPLLLSAKGALLSLWSSESPQPTEPKAEPERVPLQENPLPAPSDNGIAARTLVPNDPSGYVVAGLVYIGNSSSHALNAAELAAGKYDAALTGEEPQILILHTHGSESYTPAKAGAYVESGDHRTTDCGYNVVRIGDEMAEQFSAAGISVLHDRTLYDYPAYAGAYTRSMAATAANLKKYPSLRFILDIHRDAICDSTGKQYKVVSEVAGKGTAAQLSLIVGSDGSGAEHPRWKENLKLAVALQQGVLEEYPTLMRPVALRNSRYNQQQSTGSLLVEVGAAGNSPEEALLAARLFTERMVATLRGK